MDFTKYAGDIYLTDNDDIAHKLGRMAMSEIIRVTYGKFYLWLTCLTDDKGEAHACQLINDYLKTLEEK